MVFRRGRGLRPINSVKHIVESSTILAAGVNTILDNITLGVDTYSLASTDGCPTGSRVSSFYLSVFVIAEGGEIASEVPLVDWYIIKNNGNTFGTTFGTTTHPTPGTTGTHINKRFIIHTEKGLAGGGDVSLAGVPMIFKGVIRIPKGMQRIGQDDKMELVARANFNSKICWQAIYKHYD